VSDEFLDLLEHELIGAARRRARSAPAPSQRGAATRWRLQLGAAGHGMLMAGATAAVALVAGVLVLTTRGTAITGGGSSTAAVGAIRCRPAPAASTVALRATRVVRLPGAITVALLPATRCHHRVVFARVTSAHGGLPRTVSLGTIQAIDSGRAFRQQRVLVSVAGGGRVAIAMVPRGVVAIECRLPGGHMTRRFEVHARVAAIPAVAARGDCTTERV
jgi:hypothetical protein